MNKVVSFQRSVAVRLLSVMLLGVLAHVGVAASPQAEIEEKVPLALKILDGWQAKEAQPGERKLHLVYWTPKDREPSDKARLRLTGILENIRDFYAAEMQRMGFGPRTIKLDYADDGLLKIHWVKGKKPFSAYNPGSGGEIRNECVPTLREAGIDPNNETVLIFSNLAKWDGKHRKISHKGPFYAGGSHRNGMAWQVDSPILSLDNLGKKEPMLKDSQLGKVSIGRYNSVFIGGICHELAHALGVPNALQRQDEEEAFGKSLMGPGGQHYGDEQRGDGKGPMLTLAHGLKLAAHPMFSGSVKQMDQRANARIEDLKAEETGQGFRVSGRVKADPPPFAVLGYMDPDSGGDSDATTCSAVPDSDGNFVLDANGLVPGGNQKFRIVVCQANGACTTYVGSNSHWTIPYEVDEDGFVDLSVHRAGSLMEGFVTEVNAGRRRAAQRELKLLASKTKSPVINGAAEALFQTLGPAPKKTPAEFEGSRLVLSRAKPTEAKVGWGNPAMDRLPAPGALVTSAGEVVVRSIYAHAPAQHRWDLGGKWKTFKGRAGLPDENNKGTVVFVILGDGEELWRSPQIKGRKAHRFSVDVSDVKDLELRVRDAGDGMGNDWGVWFEPVLTR